MKPGGFSRAGTIVGDGGVPRPPVPPRQGVVQAVLPLAADLEGPFGEAGANAGVVGDAQLLQLRAQVLVDHLTGGGVAAPYRPRDLARRGTDPSHDPAPFSAAARPWSRPA